MTYYTLQNLKTSTAKKLNGHPSLITAKPPIFSDKQGFREWCADGDTKHFFYALVEGKTPGKRVGGTNEPFRLYGVAADYDGDLPKNYGSDLVELIKKKAPGGWARTWVSKTYSGKARAIWEFEEPLMVDNAELAKTLVKLIFSETKAIKLLPGFDDCSYNLNQYWELGTSWLKVSGQTVPKVKTEALFFEAATKAAGPKGEVRIPMETLAEEVEKRFPNRWKGTFDIGARGPLFWIDDGIDRVGAVVQEGGMWCHSTRAGKSFVSWEEILGSKFVKEFKEKRIQDAVEDTYYDGKRYWVKDGTDNWATLQKEDLSMHMRLAGFSHNARKKGDPASEIDELLCFIQSHRRVKGAAPFLFNFEEVATYRGQEYINTVKHKRTMEPADHVDESKCKNLLDWWSTWLDGGTGHFFGWLKHFYEGARSGNLKPGHSLILAGGADQGKSLFSCFILPKIFGGGADAGDYLMGGESFNGELLESAVWQIDDNVSAADFRTHKRFSEMLKKVTATPAIPYRVMYMNPVMVERRGRVVITTNTDADSLAVLPNLDGTILDKLMILKLKEDYLPWFRKLNNLDEISKVIEEELPWFLSWLLDYQPPEEVTKGASPRYGAHPFHHKELMIEAEDLTPEMRDLELLEHWWAANGRKAWEGTTSSLLADLSLHDELRGLVSGLNPRGFGRTLSKLASKSGSIHKRVRDGKSIYEIDFGVQ